MSFLDQARNNFQRSFRRDSGAADTRKPSTSTAPNPQYVQPSTSYYTGWTGRQWRPAPVVEPPKPQRPAKYLSPLSTPGVPNSLWFTSDIQLAASVVIIQPSTSNYVVLSEKYTLKFGNKVEEREHWFLPRGRKDIGESLEQTAVREGYEESGYRCTLMPLNIPSRATRPTDADKKPMRSKYPNCEPIYIQIIHNKPLAARLKSRPNDGGTEYICFYYVAEIPEDAKPEANTKMWDEQGYVTHLLSLEEACSRLKMFGDSEQATIMSYAAQIWKETKESNIIRELEREQLNKAAELTSASETRQPDRLEPIRRRKDSARRVSAIV